MKANFYISLLLFGVISALFGCTSHQGLKPLMPEFGSVTDSLQPTIRWEAAQGDSITYDLIIYVEGNDIEPAYYREGLTNTSHTVEAPLKPHTRYSWSVRSRNNKTIQHADKAPHSSDETTKDVSEWTRQETTVFTGVSYHRRLNLISFTTP